MIGLTFIKVQSERKPSFSLIIFKLLTYFNSTFKLLYKDNQTNNKNLRVKIVSLSILNR